MGSHSDRSRDVVLGEVEAEGDDEAAVSLLSPDRWTDWGRAGVEKTVNFVRLVEKREGESEREREREREGGRERE